MGTANNAMTAAIEALASVAGMATGRDEKPSFGFKSKGVAGVTWADDEKHLSITLPKGTTFKRAHDVLTNAEKDLDTVVVVERELDGFPVDAQVALWETIDEEFGGALLEPTYSFFGKIPPPIITVEVGFQKTKQIPWGDMQPAGLEGGKLKSYVKPTGGRVRLVARAECKKKFEHHVREIFEKVSERLRVKSVYRGKAIQLDLSWMDEVRRDPTVYDPTAHKPTFMDTSRVDLDDLILDPEVRNALQVGLWTVIQESDACRCAGIPLKRGVLLEGPYGCGKTLTAYITAKICEDNGWTFMYLKTINKLPEALHLAKLYKPCVIFAEDIDSVIGTQERTDEVNEILNTIDGADFKNEPIATVLTTNHIDKINKAMLRPGRLDAVVTIGPPGPDATRNLIRRYGGDMLPMGVDLFSHANRLKGQIPAVIAEAVQRAKLAAIGRTGDADSKIDSVDLKAAIDSILQQVKACGEPGEKPATGLDLLAAFGSGLGHAMVHSGKNLFADSVRGGRLVNLGRMAGESLADDMDDLRNTSDEEDFAAIDAMEKLEVDPTIVRKS